MNSTAHESLLILSDVHLGNDLNDLTPAGVRRSALVDADLANLLTHYRLSPCTGKRWRLVIAGDFIDFVGMSILPREGASKKRATRSACMAWATAPITRA